MAYFWPEIISNLKLWKQTSQIAVREEILQRKWRWLRHTFRKTTACVTRHPIKLESTGKEKKEVDQKSHGNEVWSQR
jgi:hypothetical protein